MRQYFSLFFTYSQICVFNPEMSEPFNQWEERHFLQGFSWRNGSVAFDTLADGGDAEVDVLVTNKYKQLSERDLIITVPFTVSEHEKVEIASISESYLISVPKGLYSLFYENKRNSIETISCKFTFIKNDEASAQILKTPEWMKPKYPLLMKASPA